MASATVDHRPHHQNHLHLESIPVVDLRLLSQPELLSLSLCSSSPSLSNAETELFTPKIDRSVFNESAGSRKQTFFRLRLAAPGSHLHHHHSSPSSKPFPSRPLSLNTEPLDEESSSVLFLLKSLFSIDDSLTANANENEPYDDKDLVPVQIEYPIGNSVLQNIPVGIVSSCVGKRKRGRPRKDEKDNWLIESQSLVITEYRETAAFDRVNEMMNASNISGCSEGKRRRGRPRKEESQSRVIGSEEKKVESESLVIAEHKEKAAFDRVNETVSVDNISSYSEGKRRRGRPRKEERLQVIRGEEKKVESTIETVALENVGAILGIEEELRRVTEGMVTEAELLKFMGGLEGEWASKSQKKRIIDAGSFGSVLPKGWKLMLFVKRRAGHFWLACSRYISPNGQQFVSCKEVSSYLLSGGGPKDSKLGTSTHIGCGIGSGVKPIPGNLPITSMSSGHEKQASLLRMGSPREVQTETINCHKCSMTYNQQDDFVRHQLSSHQGTGKNSGHGSSTNKEVIVNNGKYECHFCHELFEERNSYSGHIRIHMKNDMKKAEGSVAVLTVQNNIQPLNSPGKNEIGSGFPSTKANENVKTYINKSNHACKLLSHDERDIKVDRNEEILAEKNFDKQNVFCVVTNNRGEVTDTAAVSAAELNVCFSSEKVLSAADKNGISLSSDTTDVRFALHSTEENERREIASKTSLLPTNAERNMFNDENIVDRRLASFTKMIGTDWKDEFARDDPKASFANTHTGRDNITINAMHQNCSEAGSLILSSKKHRGDLVDNVKGASVRIDSAQDTGCGLHGREQIFVSDHNSFKVSSRTCQMFELNEAQRLIEGMDGCDNGLDANNPASVKHERTKESPFVRSSHEKTFSGTLEGHKDKVDECSVNEQSAYRQNSNYETSMSKLSFSTIEEPKHKVESSLFGNVHARLGTFAMTGNGKESCSPFFPGNGEKFSGKNNVPGISIGTVHEPKQNSGAFEDFFCLSAREQTHVANNFNMVYAGTAHDVSRLEDFENARNNEIQFGFSNHSRPAEDSVTGLSWKSNDLLSGLADTSSELLQSSGYYPTFDLMSQKGESEMFNISGKCSSVAGFEGLRSDSIENMEYNFLTSQPSSHSGNSKVSSYDSEVAMKFDSSVWLGKEALPLFPNIAGRNQVTATCTWCGNEIYHEAVDTMIVCATCQARLPRNHDFM